MSTCTQHMPGSPTQAAPEVRFWHAVTTMPRHEKSVFAGLMQNGIDAFLPTFESLSKWRNRQKVTVIAPLFPTYLFVRIVQAERVKVLRTPGVRQFVGNSKGPAVIPTDEVESLGKAVSERKARPFDGLVEGRRVRVRSGPLQGLEGYLVRKRNEWRFVIKVQLINRHAAVEVDTSALELLDESEIETRQLA